MTDPTGTDPRRRAASWVAGWLAAPLLDGSTLSAWLTEGDFDPMSLIAPELVTVLAEALAVFEELDAGHDAPRGPVEVPADGSIRTRATVLWARARGWEVLGPDGRPAMAPSRVPSVWRGWLAWRWGRGDAARRLREEVAKAVCVGGSDRRRVREGMRAARGMWRRGIAVWGALASSKAFRRSLTVEDGIDVAPIVLPVLARGVEETFPAEVFRRAVAVAATGQAQPFESPSASSLS